jgi:hypothetical protein
MLDSGEIGGIAVLEYNHNLSIFENLPDILTKKYNYTNKNSPNKNILRF